MLRACPHGHTLPRSPPYVDAPYPAAFASSYVSLASAFGIELSLVMLRSSGCIFGHTKPMSSDRFPSGWAGREQVKRMPRGTFGARRPTEPPPTGCRLAKIRKGKVRCPERLRLGWAEREQSVTPPGAPQHDVAAVRATRANL